MILKKDYSFKVDQKNFKRYFLTNNFLDLIKKYKKFYRPIVIKKNYFNRLETNNFEYLIIKKELEDHYMILQVNRIKNWLKGKKFIEKGLWNHIPRENRIELIKKKVLIYQELTVSKDQKEEFFTRTYPLINDNANSYFLLKHRIKTFLKSKNIIELKGNHIMTSESCFDRLKIAKKSSTRTTKESLYLNDRLTKLLRCHITSTFFEFIKNNKFAIKHGRFFIIGDVFRNQTHDSTHKSNFKQLELWLSNSNLEELIELVKELLEKVLYISNPELRVRTYQFKFTNPSLEIDVFINGKWLELVGGGLFYQDILQSVGVKPQYFPVTGFAIGYERLLMLYSDLENINDSYQTTIFRPKDQKNK